MTICRLLAAALCAAVLLQMPPASSASGVEVTVPPGQTPAAVLAAGAKAAAHWMKKTPIENNDWTGATFLIGLMEYYKATVAAGAPDASALSYARRWAEHYDFQLCTDGDSTAAVASTAGRLSRWRDCHLMALPPSPSAGVSTGINRGCHQNDSLADG